MESTMDVTQAVERLNITLELLEGVSERKLARCYYEVCMQGAYALCEKVEGLIAYACKVHLMVLETRRGYQALVKPVRDLIDKDRTAYVRGANRPAGKTAIAATAITTQGFWESSVVFGPEMIKIILAGRHENDDLSVQDYRGIATRMTGHVYRMLGLVLEKVDQGVSS